jgi:hypothetical protein
MSTGKTKKIGKGWDLMPEVTHILVYADDVKMLGEGEEYKN